MNVISVLACMYSHRVRLRVHLSFPGERLWVVFLCTFLVVACESILCAPRAVNKRNFVLNIYAQYIILHSFILLLLLLVLLLRLLFLLLLLLHNSVGTFVDR